MAKSPEAFRTISEVAEWLGTPAHVLRFWESRFAQVKPVKRAGGRRYYRPADMELLGGIKQLLHEDGMTIRGVQKLLRTEGVRHVASFSMPLDGIDEAAASTTHAAQTDADRAMPTNDTKETPSPAAVDTAPVAQAADPEPEPEAPMSEDVEPEPLDNLVALKPSSPELEISEEPVAQGQAADETDPAMETQTPVSPEIDAPVSTTEDSALQEPVQDPVVPQPAEPSAAPPDASPVATEPVTPTPGDEATPAPLFQSANRMRDTAEAVVAENPVAPESGAEAAIPTMPPLGLGQTAEPVAPHQAEAEAPQPEPVPVAPVVLGADIPEDPASDAQFDTNVPADLPNIISLAQAMRANRKRPDAAQVDTGTMTRLYDRLVQLRDQMRAKG